ncbi:Stp1/IreP family PP2C-type Ser/Thr phosphatase [Actinomadura parmotrematis]|uniref:Stp1/IreP family PP2C-type Ser/Thr phosphatase n=1 Tax=Actinomadura parmotrematis TaxID=2864039 RepID=A0ABS7FN35_9ACTN|nr:Stp1/IreP family PP2C-type Ser/Thr phosphatase [Actinomadura parmotrematis]MBW8481804.1 Stp1/IreP family PP2C-type Ser/Thr phosphatase [Actinomadura parmotrematis]
MTLGIRYAARSDVGMLREGNEDSAYAGTHLLAVADGMGGHVGGEIASAAAIDALRRLDTDLPANELLAALEHTVRTANDDLHRIVESDPALQGMGTTLTAMLWAGDQVALVHIGDSRAYLLRDGSLFQITHDHTLVQSLVDEGRISPDEAASHPQRSLLLRALDGRSEVEPDLSLREAKAGDRYLLCSDGLSGVITAETIFQVLTEVDEPDQAVRQLIDLANRGGGPDNITCVVADVVDLAHHQVPQGPGRAVGAAANSGGPGAPGGGPAAATTAVDTPAGRAAQLRDTMPQPPVALEDRPNPHAQHEAQHGPQHGPAGAPPAAAPGRRRRGLGKWTWLVVAAGVVVVGIAATGFFVVKDIRSGYYIGADKGEVVLFRGTSDDVPLISLSRRADADQQSKPPMKVADLPQAQQEAVRKTYVVKGPSGITDLQKIVCRYALVDEGGKVAVVRGRDQPNCQETKVKGSEVALADLPPADVQSVRGFKPVIGQAAAEAALKTLTDHQAKCKAGDTSVKDCPQGAKS